MLCFKVRAITLSYKWTTVLSCHSDRDVRNKQLFWKRMDKYKIIGHLSGGAHGVVLKAVSRRSRQDQETSNSHLFAIKRIPFQTHIRVKKKIPRPILREIKCLKLLSGQESIVSLLEVIVGGNSVNLVFPLLPSNLSSIIYEKDLSLIQKKAYAFMLLQGIHVIHSNGIIHRDLKPANLLVDWNGRIKICDFGQGRLLSTGLMSHEVSTRWYRAPELLYGAEKYSEDVDLWSAGCIVAEIFLRRPLFASDSDIGQLFLVVSSLGPPPQEWAVNFPDYNKISFNVEHDELVSKSMEWKNNLSKSFDEDMFQVVLSLCCYTNRLDANSLLHSEPFLEFDKNGINHDILVIP